MAAPVGDSKAAFSMSFVPPVAITAKVPSGYWVERCQRAQLGSVPAPSLRMIRRYGCPCSKSCGCRAINSAANCSKPRCPNGSNIMSAAKGPLAREVKAKLLAISPAQIDRLLRPVRVSQPKKGLCTTKPGTLLRRHIPTRSGPPDTSKPGAVEADTVAHCGDTTAGDYVNSLTFTELYSGWTENRAVWNKSSHAILTQLKALETVVSFPLTSFHSDNGSEFLNWPLYEFLTGRPLKVPWTRSRAYRKNDNAHCEQKNWTRVRQLLGYERFEHPELVAPLNELYSQEWSQYQNHFRPTFKLLKREKQGSKTIKTYENQPKTPYQRLLESPDLPEALKNQMRTQHVGLDPFALKKGIEKKLTNFFTLLGNLNRQSTKT